MQAPDARVLPSSSGSQTTAGGGRCRVLFIAEAVTLAHVARAYTLARGLDAATYDVHLAWDPRYNHLLGPMPFPYYPMTSLSTSVFLARLSRGAPMHDTRTLRDYVEEDLHTISVVKPDVVVGDFRISLAASARLAGIPHVAIANAYWSPYGRQTFRFPEYDYPLGQIVGRRLSQLLFDLLRPIGFAAHTRPLNRVLRERGLPPIGGDIRTMYTFGDYTAYADIPELFPLEGMPATHRHVGAVLWSPAIATPSWWDDIPADRPVVYVTLGSSGEAASLPMVMEALSELPVTVLAATAGRPVGIPSTTHAYLADFLPGIQAAARSSVVIGNGGSPTTYQALAAGVPVLGLASNNMDQHLNMEGVVRAGAGIVLRARGASPARIRGAVQALLEQQSYRQAALELARAHAAHTASPNLSKLVAEAAGLRRS